MDMDAGPSDKPKISNYPLIADSEPKPRTKSYHAASFCRRLPEGALLAAGAVWRNYPGLR